MIENQEVLRTFEKISKLKGIGFDYGKILKKKVLDILNNEVFWEEFTSLNENINILKQFNLKNCKLYIEINEESIKNLLHESLLCKKEFITFSKDEYEKSETCFSITFNQLFDKFSSKGFIELFFNEKNEDFFFSEIDELGSNPIHSLFIILYLEDISLFATPSQLFDKEEKERSYKSVKDSIKIIKEQINLIISTELYCPSYIFEIKLEKGLYDLNKLHIEHDSTYFQRDLLIMENYLFNNLVINKQLYLQDYVFCFNECMAWEDLIVLLAVKTPNRNSVSIATKIKNLIKPKYFSYFIDLQSINEKIKEISVNINDFLVAYMLMDYEKEILKYTDFDVSFQKTLRKKNCTYTPIMITDVESLLNKKNIYKKFYQHLFIKKGGLTILEDFNSIILKNNKEINADTFKKTLISKLRNTKIFLESSNFFKRLILQELGKEVESSFYGNEAYFEEFIKVIPNINLDVKFSPELDKNIAKFKNPWRKNTKDKTKQFLKNNTKSLFYNDLERFLKLESELNEEISEEIIKEKLYPTNKDVYSFLKAIVVGDGNHIKNKELKRLFKNRKNYKKVVILVFDGLGLALLKWGSYQKGFETLKRLLNDENNFSIIQSNLPSFTGVNHIAMLSDKEVFEDAFFKRVYDDGKQSCTFEKEINKKTGRYTKKFKGYRIQHSEEFKLFSSVSDLFSYNTDEWLGVTKHIKKDSFLSNIIFKNIEKNNLIKATQYNVAVQKALLSNKKLTISQVNIFDQFMEKYDDSKRPIKNLDEFFDFFIDLLRNVTTHINNNIQKGTLVIITSDHGLTWIKSDNIIKLPNPKVSGKEELEGTFVEELNEELEDEIVSWDKEGQQAHIKISTKSQQKADGSNEPVALFYPTFGPRRVASFYIMNSAFKSDLLQALEKINNGRYNIKVNKEPREFDPDVILFCKNQIFNSRLDKNKFFVGLHGGISIHELIVPLIVFDEETWSKCKK